MQRKARSADTILNQVITYEVDQIRIVLPSEVEDLQIVPGKDYCTLVTCTPYGINTHRMLVRAHRIENIPGEVVVTPGGVRIPTYIVIPAVGVPLLFVFLLFLLIYYSVKPKKRTHEEILHQLRQDEPKDDDDG